jgi:predicted house-cleaning noncanonical NTP pyrophosphatase (MazG superfamily)
MVPYNTLQELLEELKTLPDTYDEDKWMKFSKPFLQDNAKMDTAKLIRTMLPDIVRETYRTVTGLIAQLSPCVQECLRSGVPIQTIEDALDSKLQELATLSEPAVNSSGLGQKQVIIPESTCHQLMLTTPLETATILQDLKVLPQLGRVSIQSKGEPFLLNKNWKMGCTVLNTTLQELLEELKTLPDTYDEDSFMKKVEAIYPGGPMRCTMDHAKRIRALIPDIVRETHRTISTLIAQLSPCVQECLRAGLPIQTIEDALDSKLQEANYAFARKV